MRRAGAVAAVGLAGAGCGTGTTHASFIEDVQVVSVINTPPEASAGEVVLTEVTVADPKARGVEVLVWTCTRFELACLEATAFQLNPAAWLGEARLVSSGRHQVTRSVPWEVDDLLEELELSQVETVLLVLACAPGRCPIIAQARDAIAQGQVPDALALDLADPSRWLASLPIAGVSLAVRGFPLSQINAGTRNTNPLVDARFLERDDDPIVVSAGGEQEMSFLVEDAERDTVYAYAYTTWGRFEERRVREDDGVVRHYFLAPTQPGEGHVYVVFEDEEGGAALWERAIVVP